MLSFSTADIVRNGKLTCLNQLALYIQGVSRISPPLFFDVLIKSTWDEKGSSNDWV